MSQKAAEFGLPNIPQLSITDKSALNAISTETLTAYLELTGYAPSYILPEGRMFRHPEKNGQEIYVPNKPASRHHKTVQMALDAIAAREKRSALHIYLEMHDMEQGAETPSVAIIGGDALAAINHMMAVEADGMEVCPDYDSRQSCSGCAADPDRGENMDCAEMRAHDRIYRAIAGQLSRPAHLRKEDRAGTGER